MFLSNCGLPMALYLHKPCNILPLYISRDMVLRTGSMLTHGQLKTNFLLVMYG